MATSQDGEKKREIPSPPVEVEVKFFLPDPKAARERLTALGAKSRGAVFESNTLYDDKTRSIARQGALLRLRKDTAWRLTLKTPPPVEDPGFKVQVEREITVSDGGTLAEILAFLGFHPAARYEKRRETFHLGETEAVVDEMPFGVFLEIEGKPDAIRALARELGLAWEERIILNYMKMFHIIREGEGMDVRDLTFDNLRGRAIDMQKYLPRFIAG